VGDVDERCRGGKVAGLIGWGCAHAF
jgi:hypothetical protein